MIRSFLFSCHQYEQHQQHRHWLAGLAAIFLAATTAVGAQDLPWPQRIANTTMQRWPEIKLHTAEISNNSLGILVQGMNAVWYDTADSTYYRYAKQAMDQRIASDGSVLSQSAATHSLDNVALGQPLLFLYRVTQDASYYRAATLLHTQLTTQLRDDAGETLSAPTDAELKVWEEGLLAMPFSAEYASVFQQPQDFAVITRQFFSMKPRTEHSRTNVTAPYLMALVDTLPYYPEDDPGRASLLKLLQHTADAVVRGQDNEPVSTACVLVYALQKGVRLGYLPRSDARTAARAWRGVLKQTVRNPDNDPTTVGEILLASTEMEMAPTATLARGDTVLLDTWFNSQQRQNAAGQKEFFHYKWNDESNDGYSIFGHIFKSYGAALGTLDQAPTLQRLRRAQFYMIVSPDIPAKNPHPHYVQPEDANQVAAWVRQGGVLVLLENDPANADIEHLDLMADHFGIHFNQTLSHHIIADQFAPGEITVRGATPLFHHSHTLYMKDTCTLTLQASATPLLSDASGVVMATAKYGKGMVFAGIDPWLYNEYTDHRKLLPEQDNYAAGKEFVLWLLRQQQNARAAEQRK